MIAQMFKRILYFFWLRFCCVASNSCMQLSPHMMNEAITIAETQTKNILITYPTSD